MYIILTFLLCLTISSSFGADILVCITTPSFSHQAPLRPIWKELARRGHNITLITTDPIKNSSLTSIKEIDISYAYQVSQKHQIFDIAMNDSKSFREMGAAFQKGHAEMSMMFFESIDGQNLIHNKDNHFDLLIMEAHFSTFTIFSWKYDIPYIGICSLDCAMHFHDTAGNSVHPVSNPDTNFRLENPYKPTFSERLLSFVFVILFRIFVQQRVLPKDQVLLQKYFGEDVPPIEEVQNRLSMLFVSTNPVFHNPRAVMPNTISIGNGMHIEDTTELEPEVKEFLDGASQGAVYFSLGSNIKDKHLNNTIKNSIITALASLPYRVLWKTDGTFDSLPPHIKTSKWFKSQPSILQHPNVKVFITQGGLQSMQESVFFGKPMIGIPFFGDQYSNVNRMVHLEYGVKIDKHNVSKTSIREAVEVVINHPKYYQNAQKYGEIYKDVDITDVNKAVWWIEYVLRHKGAQHFRNRLLDMPFWQRHLLDVYAFVILVLFIVYKTVRFALNFGFAFLFKRNRKSKRD